MTEKTKKKSAAQAAKRASASRKAPAKMKEAGAKPKKASAAKTAATKPAKAAGTARAKTETKTKAKTAAGSGTKQTSGTHETIPKTKTPAASRRKAKKTAEETFAGYRPGEPVLDPIGDTSDGEGRTYTGEGESQAKVEMEAFRADTNLAATDSGIEAGRGFEAAQEAAEESAREAAEAAATRDKVVVEEDGESESEAPGPAKLERLQKILSQAGIASRRHAEEMIVAGRVMVNGEVVTQLGSKADPARDHIRVDGKLLHGAERHRYFMLNKPKGYVTTVSDPEGRPTVMQFFAKMHERVYPVGRLDFQSEGLLLMTNDGELANLITRAESGVEKTYLVKVAGQPNDEQLERLRGGVAIERGEAGSERVRTAPARIYQVRKGDNPWYEVVLTEGRNRELRKMFASIGHFAEKIRRVGYGPLELDVEPGKMRELRPEEVAALRFAAEGKMKPRRIRAERMLPKEAGISAEKRNKFREPRTQAANARFRRPDGGSGKPAGSFGQRELREKKTWGSDDRPRGRREDQSQKTEWRPRDREFRERSERRPFGGGEGQERGRVQFQGGNRPFSGSRSASGFKGRTWDTRKPSQFGGRREGQRPFGGQPRGGKPPFEPRSSGNARREHGESRFDGERRKPFPPRSERPPFERGARPSFKPDGEQKRPFRSDRAKNFGSDRGKNFGHDAKFGTKPRGFAKPHSESDTGKRFGADRGKSFGGSRGKSFGSGPKFGAKPGRGGQFRSGGSRSRKPGFGGRGAKPGGWKRG